MDNRFIEVNTMQTMIPTIEPTALHQVMARGNSSILLDVRSASEFADGHAEGAVNLPLEQADAGGVKRLLGADAGSGHPLYLICASGRRAALAADNLRSQGLENLTLVDGGTQAWKTHRLPMRRESKLPSLERQTQIALGVVLLALLAKGSFLHPLFFGLTGLLGVGLIVAGLTAQCALTSLLARMPWNRNTTAQPAA